MAEPTTCAVGAVGANTVACLGVLGAILTIDPAVFCGAFAGAVIFVMHPQEFSLIKRVVYFPVSLLLGYLLAWRIDAWIPWVSIPPEAGAIIASTSSIKILNGLMDVDIVKIALNYLKKRWQK